MWAGDDVAAGIDQRVAASPRAPAAPSRLVTIQLHGHIGIDLLRAPSMNELTFRSTSGIGFAAI